MAIDEHRVAPDLRDDRRLRVLRQREHVHPGVHAQPRGVRALEQQRERVDPGGGARALIGRRVGERAVVPGAAAAVDLHEQVGRAERPGVAHELVDPLRMLEHAAVALGQHPERAMRRARGGGLGLGAGAAARRRCSTR